MQEKMTYGKNVSASEARTESAPDGIGAEQLSAAFAEQSGAMQPAAETAKKSPPRKKNAKNKIIWTIVFIAIAALTVWAVTAQNKDFSFTSFVHFLSNLKIGWVIGAVGAMLAFVIFEGLALLTLSRAFGYKRSVAEGVGYSAADIYFSAITPSATGGQPASGYLMMRDRIPGSVTTVVLIANLVMYTMAIIIIGVVSFILNPLMFMKFSVASRVLIIIGCVCQVFMAVLFILLLRRGNWLLAVGNVIIAAFAKIRILRNPDKLRDRLRRYINNYSRYSAQLKGKGLVLMHTLIYNVLQRLCLIVVTVMCFLAAGGSGALIISVFVAQSMVVLGSNTIPIPGAMGVIDFLTLDVFSAMITATAATNLDLLSRSVSFYFCVFLCGITFLIRCVLKPKIYKDAN